MTIDMKSDRVALEGEVRDLGGIIQSLKGQLSHTDYRHTEFEGANPGTVFRNKGSDFRLEARHARFGKLDGVVGFQAENNRFSADGAEAFAPYSRTSQKALFAYEEYATHWGKLSFGGRLESVSVESLGNLLVARFVPATRDFTPHSYALGALWNTAPGWQVTTNLAYTERAPKDYELFAQGPHVATHAWETGDSALAKEKSTSLDVGTSWKAGANSFAANVYMHRFRNYIGLLGTGNSLARKMAYSIRLPRMARPHCRSLPTPACAPALPGWKPAATSACWTGRRPWTWRCAATWCAPPTSAPASRYRVLRRCGWAPPCHGPAGRGAAASVLTIRWRKTASRPATAALRLTRCGIWRPPTA